MTNHNESRWFRFRTRDLLVCSTVVAILVWLLGTTVIAVADGHFLLTVAVQSKAPLDPENILFAYCWSPEEVEHALKNGEQGEKEFRHALTVKGNIFTFSLPHSGRYDRHGNELSYHEPAWIVILERSKTGVVETPTVSKHEVPPGRGNRRMEVTLPTRQATPAQPESAE